MLGETVLQMVISEISTREYGSFARAAFDAHTATVACSFVIAWCMMISFRQMVEAQIHNREEINEEVAEEAEEEMGLESTIKQAHDSEGKSAKWSMGHLLSNSSAIAELERKRAAFMSFDTESPAVVHKKRIFDVISEFLWQELAVCVMLVGVGVKLALIEPELAGGDWRAENSRLIVALPLGLAFTIQNVHTMTIAHGHYYAISNLRKVPSGKLAAHFGIILVRCVMTGLGIGLAFVDMTLLAFYPVQAAISVAQVTLMYTQEHGLFCSIKEDHAAEHPLADMPKVMTAIRIVRRQENTKLMRSSMSPGKATATRAQRQCEAKV